MNLRFEVCLFVLGRVFAGSRTMTVNLYPFLSPISVGFHLEEDLARYIKENQYKSVRDAYPAHSPLFEAVLM